MDIYIGNKNKNNQFFIWTAVIAGILIFGFGIYQFASPQVEVTWSTATEVDTYGYNLLRSYQIEGPFDFQVNDQIIEATGQPVSGSKYSFVDRNVKIGITYYYQLEEVQNDSSVEHFGPIKVKAKPGGWVEICLSLIIFASTIFYLRNSR